MKAGRRTGFTLIELLVVIAIIAILAAILFPVFAKAKQASQRAACMGHIKQIGSAMKLYQQDYNGAYPSCLHSEAYSTIWLDAYWIRMLMKTHLPGRGGVFRCPGAAKLFPVTTTGLKNGYCYNEYIVYRDRIAAMGNFYDESRIPRPKHTLLLADGFFTTLVDDWNDVAGNPNAMPPNYDGLPSGMLRVKYADGLENMIPRLRHGSSNILFCDMHTVNVKPSNFRAVNFPGWNNSNCQEWPVIYPLAKPIPP